MKLKNTILAIALVASSTLFAQHSGNVNQEDLSKKETSGNYNYQNPNQYHNRDVPTIQTSYSNDNEMVITIKGIYNEKASCQKAVFSVLQVGKTAEEVTDLMDERLDAVMNQLKTFNAEIEVITDMISFVPMYDYEITKKVFNTKTYNEKPGGFELKKNLSLATL